MTSAWNKIVLHLSIIDIDKNYNFRYSYSLATLNQH